MTERSTPSVTESIRRMIESRVAEIHTCLPGRVERYDSATERADVLPLLKRTYRSVDGEVTEVELPLIVGALVQWPRFGGWVIRGELAPGDIVGIKFSERSLERWLASDHGTPVSPRDTRKHDLSDAIVEPGLVPYESAGAADITIGRDDGSTEIRMKATGEIMLSAGGEADQHLVRGEALLDWLGKLTVPTAFGPSGTPIVPPPPSLLSSLAKVR